jgi:hypothetical protein
MTTITQVLLSGCISIVALFSSHACSKKNTAQKEYSCEEVTANVTQIMKEMAQQTESVDRCKTANFSPAVRKCMATARDLNALATCFPAAPREPKPSESAPMGPQPQ